MNYIKHAIAACAAMGTLHACAQEVPDSTITDQNLDDVVISANKVPENKKTIAQQAMVLTKQQIADAQAQTTADLLANTGSVFVQKSQAGGGSPVLRGFEANRILMVVDGVRMNNLIYRGGHLQNVITVDNAMLERAEVLFGPSSTVYGSDALGGVVHFYTKKPKYTTGGGLLTTGDAYLRYGSVNQEKTGHADLNIGGKKLASLTSFTYSDFGDLRGGTQQNPLYDTLYGMRPYYVERINGKDSLVKNADPYLQVQSGYRQYDLLQKLAYKQNEHVEHVLNLQYSTSTDIPRYDRLTDRSATGLRSAQWYYGPQERVMAAYDVQANNRASFFQYKHAGINYQQIEESRHNRNYGRDGLAHRVENVGVAGLNVDMQRVTGKHSIRLGLDGQYNTLKSTAEEENIVTGVRKPLDTRYPGGDNTMLNTAVYASHTMNIDPKWTLTDGLRLGYIALNSQFNDTSFFQFPFTEAKQQHLVYSGSAGLIYHPSDKWRLTGLLSTGFRAPNVDDLAKVFETVPGYLIVPNKDLKAEKTINGELGATVTIAKKIVWTNNVYYTQFVDAIVTGNFSYNGQDSIVYNGTKSQVLANQNNQSASVSGFSSALKADLGKGFLLSGSINYTYGRIKTDTTPYPLDHIPPMMMRAELAYRKGKLGGNFFVLYQGAKKLKDYNRNGEDNEQYATPDGMPAWFTANLRVQYQVHKLVMLQAGIDNLLDTQYRVFASGVNAPGRNIFAAVRFHY